MPNVMTTIKVHLADDHQILIDGITRLLQANTDFEVVGTSLNGNNIYQEVNTNKADVLILDLSMPQKDGIEVLIEFNQNNHPCKIIILSSYDDLKIVKEVITLGAFGYLTKQCAGENIAEAIETVFKGEQYFCEQVRENILTSKKNTLNKINSTKAKKISNLTEREIEIITLIALEYSGKEISEKLFISTNTVETHRKNIIKKIKAKNTISIVKFAIKNNLIET
jgi:DNA-binding NarL/FixJ family response regulator